MAVSTDVRRKVVRVQVILNLQTPTDMHTDFSYHRYETSKALQTNNILTIVDL
jgi:hypothetical protein